jgi:hypothetical protein
MWYTPLVHQAERVVFHSRHDVRAVPHVRKVLAAAEESVEPPALALPDQLSRVLACEADTNLARETMRVAGGLRVHAALEAHELENATLTGGFVYARGLRMPLRPRGSKWLGHAPSRRFEHALCTSSLYGLRYFGHFLTDDCSAAQLAHELGAPAVRLALDYPQASAYERAFGTPLESVEDAHFARLTVLSDVGQSSSKRRRYQRMRALVRRVTAVRSSGRGVYLRRSLGGPERVPRNDDDVAARLVREGFTLACVDDPPEVLFRALNQAPLVLGVEGSHMVHGVFHVRDGGALLCVQPPRRFNNVLKDYTDCLGLRYGFVVAEPQNAGFFVNETDLMRTIELVERAQGVNARSS